MSSCSESDNSVFSEDDYDPVKEGDLVQIIAAVIAQGCYTVPRATLHGQPVPSDSIIVLIQEIQAGDSLGNDLFGEPVGLGAYISVSTSCLLKSEYFEIIFSSV
uniref:Uncharacterized protein n=1 Tax=Spongospora subterranea TaxID=70186 RepID=A0A0H5RBW5_9EUKA|eukprot:CRZ05979.1 hypothetical protein [Spongospora subterranea]